MSLPLRVLLDVNVWVANLMATRRGRQGTAAQRLVSMVASGRWGYEQREVQLVISLEMLDTLNDVLRRQGASPESAEAYTEAVKSIMKYGPDELDPYLLLGGREQIAITDIEDAGVLATAYASRAGLVITDNLKDFRTKDTRRLNTRCVKTSSGMRQLYALRHRRPEVDVVVAHPLDVVAWLAERLDFEPDLLWSRISGDAAD